MPLLQILVLFLFLMVVLLPRFPRGTISHHEMTRAGAVEIRPDDWGGRDWHFGLQGQAVLIRGGEGLVGLPRGEKNLYPTVDDCARGAALIERLPDSLTVSPSP